LVKVVSLGLAFLVVEVGVLLDLLGAPPSVVITQTPTATAANPM
jgi:hypothetical protein